MLEPGIKNEEIINLQKFKLLFKLKDEICKITKIDYLNFLQKINKWHVEKPSIQNDQLIILKDINSLKVKIILGSFKKYYYQNNWYIKIINTKFQDGIVKRRIEKIIPNLEENFNSNNYKDILNNYF